MKKANFSNGNGVSHKEEVAEAKPAKTNGGPATADRVFSAADLLEVPPEYRSNGLKSVIFRAVTNEEELLAESSAADFNPVYVYQYFKEPGDDEAREEAATVLESSATILNDDEDGSSNDASEAEEEEEEGQGMNDFVILKEFMLLRFRPYFMALLND